MEKIARLDRNKITVKTWKIMQLSPQQTQELKAILENCLKQLYTDHIKLIQLGGLENTLSNRLADYLRQAINQLDWINEINEILRKSDDSLQVDVGYSKHGTKSKTTPHKPKGSAPDIIIHRRIFDDFNVLVIEIKGWWNKYDRQLDKDKLADYTNQDGEYRYGLGVLLELNADSYGNPEYFQPY